MIYILLGLLMLLAGIAVAAWFAYQNRELRDSMAQQKAEEDPAEALKREQAIRRNLQRICDRRVAEVRKLREDLRASEARAQELENQITQLNVNLFQESGRRILAEKDEGARRMKQELADKQLTEAKDRLRQQEAEAKEREAGLRETIAGLEAENDRLRASRARHSPRRSAAQPDSQITVDEILKEAKE